MAKRKQNQNWVWALVGVAALGILFLSTSTGNFSLNLCTVTPLSTPTSATFGQWKEVVWQSTCDNGVSELRYCPPETLVCNDDTSAQFYSFSGKGTAFDYLKFDQIGTWQYYIRSQNGDRVDNSGVYTVNVQDPSVQTSIVKSDGVLVTPCKEKRIESDGSATWIFGINVEQSGQVLSTCKEINSNVALQSFAILSVLPSSHTDSALGPVCWEYSFELTVFPVNKLLFSLNNFKVYACTGAVAE